ncbi:uricase-2 isozyme 2-like isoform X2 [Chenopodium quinoa]|uniref:uricase-2 isozyme 2-like isoform X2 n=1 Tax=Chenopodium quinoa TaxID=63459 RepID=UPI000B794286|nr:uricase-2 isozyme 2-like isoform X2 [Chenopodium quinoa]
MAEKAKIIDGLKFEQRHGKQRVRVGRVWKDSTGFCHFVEWSVGISLLSDCNRSYTHDDNSDIVATDTMKNTVYAKAKESKEQITAEDFAILLAKHFTSYYKQVTTAIVKIVEKPWKRVNIDGRPHKHGFELGSEKHVAEAVLSKSGALNLSSSIEGLSLLKTTKSGFEGYVRDQYTLLPETRERMLATELAATWRFHVISSVSLRMPNLHFIPVNLSSIQNPNLVKFADDVYLPTDEPHGSIEASLSRLHSRM